MAQGAVGSSYRLVEAIGQGAMGTVWRADGPGGPVAIKVLRPDVAHDPDVIERFLRERTILVSLRSPHIVAVRDLVAEGSQLAVVMDLVEGEDLRAVLHRERTLAPARAIAIVRQMLEGLADAHTQGVVHRDVKPENILVTTTEGRETIRIVDFGVARITGAAATTTTGVVGTPNYMAPEVARGEVPDGAADVYGAGVVLYEALFGRPPFTGRTVAGVIEAIETAPLVRPDSVPDALWSALMAMLERRADRRATAVGAAATLGSLRADAVPSGAWPPLQRSDPDGTTATGRRALSTVARPPGARPDRRLRAWLVTLVVVLIVGGLGAAWVLTRPDTTGAGPCVRASSYLPDPAPYPDGEEIVWSEAAAEHHGRFYAGTWIGFGNRGLPGGEEEAGMLDAGALVADPTPTPVDGERYRSLRNRPPDGAVFREWKPLPANPIAPPRFFVAVGGTVVPTDAAGVRSIGRDPEAAVAVPRFGLDDLEQLEPVDGTTFRMGDQAYVVKGGNLAKAEACPGARLQRAPESAAFLERIPT